MSGPRFAELDPRVRSLLSEGPEPMPVPIGSGSPGDLAGAALDWCSARLRLFDPRSRTLMPSFPEGPLLEMVILARLALERLRPSGTRAVMVDRCLDTAAAVLATPETQARFARETALFPQYAGLAVLLERSGRRPLPGLCSYLAQLTEARGRGGLNALGLMKLRHYLELGRVPHGLPSFDELYADSLPGSPLDPCGMSDLDSYAVTHVVFFVTDLGGHAPRLSPSHADELRGHVRRLLAVSVASRNWDLVAEFLLCWRALGMAPSALTELAWSCLAGAQTRDGMVPGPHHDPGAGPGRAFATCYHTTLVTAMAGIVWEAPDAV